MPRDSVNGHWLVAPSASQAPHAAAQRPAATPHRQTQATSCTAGLQANGEELHVGLTRSRLRPGPTEAELRELAQKFQRKATPYLASGSDPRIRLNCKVRVKPSEAVAERERVGCRHLALEFAKHDGKKRDVIQAFSTTEGIEEKFDGMLDETNLMYKAITLHGPPCSVHLVNSEQFGAYLTAIATELQDPGSTQGPSQANCLIRTHDHAMALHVQRKCKFGVQYFAAKLYDPNYTALYLRVVRSTPQAFGDLQLKDMIHPLALRSYAGGENRPLSMAIVSLDDRVQPTLDRGAVVPSVQTMHFALSLGLLEELDSMLRFALEGGQAPDEHIELLRGVHGPSGSIPVPGLFMANQLGRTGAVKAFCAAVLASRMSEPAKIDLLTAKSSQGVPGFCMAFATGQTEVVKVFSRAILESSLSEPAKIRLLMAMATNGVPGLHLSFQLGHTEVVSAFAEAVLASSLNEFSELSEQAMIILLTAMTGDGVPGFYRAFQFGHTDLVTVFVGAVLASGLSDQAKIDLLTAMTTQGSSGPHVGLQLGQTNVIQAFTEAVLASRSTQSAKDSLLWGVNGTNHVAPNLATSPKRCAASSRNASRREPDETDDAKAKRQRTG